MSLALVLSCTIPNAENFYSMIDDNAVLGAQRRCRTTVDTNVGDDGPGSLPMGCAKLVTSSFPRRSREQTFKQHSLPHAHRSHNVMLVGNKDLHSPLCSINLLRSHHWPL